MNLKTYSADSMAAALALVKKELGSSAVILHTRTYKRGGLWGIGARTVVEVTAADGAQIGRRPAKRPAPAAPNVAAKQPQTPQLAGDLIRRTYAVARAELAARQAAAPTPVAAPPAIAPVAGPAAPAGQITQELRAVREMVEKMMRRQLQQAASDQPAGRQVSSLPGKLFDQYMALLKQEVTEELADDVIHHVREVLSPEQFADEKAVQKVILQTLTKLIPTDMAAGRLEPTSDGRPRTIALIGPTGVGKTTTIAKLAATFKLKQKKNVGLITLDTYRIAAVDQLRTYANIIGVPLHVAMTPDELTTALQRCAAAGCDVVLIDTAGRSQRDDPRLEQLASFIKTANPHEVHLVLSSTCTQAVLLDAVERFARVRTDRIIFTKLDEAVSFGVVLNVMTKVNKRLSYVTTGQEVPHQIEPGRPERLAALLLGGSV